MEGDSLRLEEVTFRHRMSDPSRLKPWRTRPGPGVHSITLSLRPGEILGLVGPNGAGKTTLLRTIAGVLPIQNGKVVMMSNAKETHLDSDSLRNIVGHMPEQVRWQGRQSVQDALLELAEMRGASAKRVNGLLRLVGLGQRATAHLSDLSQGMRQRLTLAAALLGSPKFLLLDEPLNGLDPVAATAFVQLLHELKNKGVSIIISSHQVEGLEAITDRIALMHRGQLLANGTLAEIADSLELQPTIVVAGPGKLPDLSWCEHCVESESSEDKWTIRLDHSGVGLLPEFIDRGIEVHSWNPKSPGIVELLCAATGMNIEEVGLEIASTAMLPHKSIGGEEE